VMYLTKRLLVHCILLPNCEAGASIGRVRFAHLLAPRWYQFERPPRIPVLNLNTSENHSVNDPAFDFRKPSSKPLLADRPLRITGYSQKCRLKIVRVPCGLDYVRCATWF
jgi:hypothetical protein